MKNKLIIIFSALIALIFGISSIYKNSDVSIVTSSKNQKIATQYIVLLDLSDRISQDGQIETDKTIIKNLFQNFKKDVFKHLIMNSKDRFQICIAPQKYLGFDKNLESDELTIDLSKFKSAEKLKKLTSFENLLSSKMDSLYNKAYKGRNSKNYQGSNIWQYFNEELLDVTNEKYLTKLIVLTDGYFDFEKGNAEIKNDKGSTTTSFISKLRRHENWKEVMKKEKYCILPINQRFKNLKICVAEIRSKEESNLNETEMLKYIWAQWLNSSLIDSNSYTTINHGPITNSQTKIEQFIN